MASASESHVRILGLKVVERALDGNSDAGLVALFDFKVSPFSIYGARLYRRRNGRMITVMPGTHRDSEGFAIRIDDEELRERINGAACDVARVLGASVDPIEPAGA